MEDHATTIYQTLLRVYNEGGPDSFAVFIADEEKNYYIQVAGEKEGDSLYAEAVSNAFLSPNFQIDDAKVKQLQEMGWDIPTTNEENFSKTWSINSDTDRRNVSNFLLKTLNQTYNLSANKTLTVNLSLE